MMSFLPPQTDSTDFEAIIERVKPPAKIHRPLIGAGDDWYAMPLERTILRFGKGQDQYGNPTGLSHSGWRITDVTIQCELKGEPDTVFNPPCREGKFWADGIENACVWYSTWTGPIEPLSGRPYSPYPESGYPFDPCWDDCGGCGYVPSQTALITARATTDCAWIRITAPAHDGGVYVLDLPGSTPQDSNVFELAVGEAGQINVVWEDGEGNFETYVVIVPTNWFWISGSWEISVDATVTSRPF